MTFEEMRIEKMVKDLGKLIFSQKQKVDDVFYCEGKEKANLLPFEPGKLWGGVDKHYCFTMDITMPKVFEGKRVGLCITTGKEGQWDATNPQMIIYVNGEIVQGLDVNHTYITLSEKAAAGQHFDVEIEAYSGMNDSLSGFIPEMYIHQEEIETLYYHLKTALECAVYTDCNEKAYVDIMKYLLVAVKMIDIRDEFSDAFYNSVLAANTYLEEEFYEKYCGHHQVVAHCIGHTHIDVAWMWTLAQTEEKAVRSFSTVLNLMKEYPEYTFMSSQPQLYQYVKKNAPKVYEQIKERIAQGRWEAEGAMWVEADCNVSSGEALVRQIMHGKAFFKEEFGVDNKVVWLPDVFGYNASLPQIFKKSGIEYFVTSKISWNETNKMPFDTFGWQGIDGTEILTYFMTAQNVDAPNFYTTYVVCTDPRMVKGTWKRYQQKGLNNRVMITYGYGDGGGGPTREMIEIARRLSKGIPGTPKVECSGALDFMRSVEQNILDSGVVLPKWRGELYLERHRGTYTSMARNKKYNRKSENLLADAEFLSVLAMKQADAVYPAEKLHTLWELVLLNQFHDILPGSSIYQVYEDSKAQYEYVLQEGEAVAANAQELIARKVNMQGQRVTVWNTCGKQRSDLVKIKLPAGYIVEGMQCQQCGEDTIFYAEDVPAMGYKTFPLVKGECGDKSMSVSAKGMENDYFAIEMDENGNLLQITDKRNARRILANIGNVLQVCEDRPRSWDAWDIDGHFEEKMWELHEAQKVELLENGPVRAGVRITRGFMQSTIVQNIYIYKEMPRIDFDTYIDWKQKQLLIKAAFPVQINAEEATYDIQFGSIKRPTHSNTSWDAAKFEVCAHQWADLSEGGYGVSLLNDCKYGYDIKQNVMRLTLLKSPIDPNPEADKEEHRFVYSLYPHMDDFARGGTVDMAFSLNNPLRAVYQNNEGGSLKSEMSLVSCDAEHVVIDTVKKAEKGNDMVVRAYECHNKRGIVHFRFAMPLKNVYECDLMEENEKPIIHTETGFACEVLPFEIKTFIIKL